VSGMPEVLLYETEVGVDITDECSIIEGRFYC
jgi:hypothetical protein